MSESVAVILNATHRKYLCVDSKATEEYSFIEVGVFYNEALLDVNGELNKIPEHCILLLVEGYPFYVRKQYLCRIDKENDDSRKMINVSPIFLN